MYLLLEFKGYDFWLIVILRVFDNAATKLLRKIAENFGFKSLSERSVKVVKQPRCVQNGFSHAEARAIVANMIATLKSMKASYDSLELEELDAMVEIDTYQNMRPEDAALIGDQKIMAEERLDTIQNMQSALKYNFKHIRSELIGFAKQEGVKLKFK
ncbi:hypothetical protein [Endozoicomonas ascidiicola]|uniref:hypothetical protein n=1 Tax=Endozoicomonas ascidiicola TaxID=1698521 RepID=UPI00082D77CB|nr:hypothetical protein [Endozoicomonas ascidiicola]